MPRLFQVCWVAALLTGSVALVSAGGSAKYDDTIKKTLTVLDKLTTTLATVKDMDTAKRAEPDLRKSTKEFIDIRKDAEKAPPPSKDESNRLAKEYKAKLEDANKKLQIEINRVDLVPGGRDILQEVRALVQKSETEDAKTPEKKSK